MNARVVRIVLVVGCAAGLAQAAGKVVRYSVHHLDPMDAALVLKGRVPEAADCMFTPERASDWGRAGIRGLLSIACDKDAVQEQIASALETIDAPPPTHRFHVAVLTASRKEGAMPDLPPGEAKALADFRKVMTYRSFQIEAETIVQTENEVEARLSPYAVELALNAQDHGREVIDVRRFKLRSAEVQTVGAGAANQTYYPSYIETSFSLRSGETIVLGSSTNDQQARVVLVTALP